MEPLLELNGQPYPPGFMLFTDFIDESLETKLFCFAQSLFSGDVPILPATNLKHRSVMHFGYSFDYDRNMVIKDNSDCTPPAIPVDVKLLGQRISDKLATPEFDQLTINRYAIGGGIPAHVDTHSSFTDCICSVSLGSAIVMELRSDDGAQKRSVLVPARSLLVLSAESRYAWYHKIAARRTDTVHRRFLRHLSPAVLAALGVSADSDPHSNHLLTVKRTERVSFTFRKVLSADVCTCAHRSLCDSHRVARQTESAEPTQSVPGCEASAVVGLTEADAARLEGLHVHDVYDRIAGHFSQTRYKPWPRVAQFLASLPPATVLLDVGCGNGKYFGVAPQLVELGCERSYQLTEICHSRGHSNVVVGDCLLLPMRPDSVDCCICIAVLHHLTTETRRQRALLEMGRVLRQRGKMLIYCWALEQHHDGVASTYVRTRPNRPAHQPVATADQHSVASNCPPSHHATLALPVHHSKTEFRNADVLVPWRSKQDGVELLRFYHLFEKGELERLVRAASDVAAACLDGWRLELLTTYYDEGNWCVVVQKRSV